jgi:hypothetical protein
MHTVARQSLLHSGNEPRDYRDSMDLVPWIKALQLQRM